MKANQTQSDIAIRAFILLEKTKKPAVRNVILCKPKKITKNKIITTHK